MRFPRPRPATLFYVALALFASAPAWIVRYPPLQDMPFHVAALRVIHSFHDPSFGIDQYFELTFGRTQYFLYYVLGSLVAYLVGVKAANVIMLCVYLGGTPLAVRSLCKALGKVWTETSSPPSQSSAQSDSVENRVARKSADRICPNAIHRIPSG